MQSRKIILLFAASVLINLSGNDSTVPHVFCIPGLGAVGSETGYVSGMLNHGVKFVNHDVECTAVETPSPFYADLGQRNCIKFATKAFSGHSGPWMVHGTSQGSATACNAIATLYKIWVRNGGKKDEKPPVRCAILEGVLPSGNKGILDTIERLIPFLKPLVYAPGAYYWLPYCAKLIQPFYNPAGDQAIKSIKEFPKDLVTILIHSTNDVQLSCEGAQALYYGLRQQGNEHTYFIEKEGYNHIRIINNLDDANVIRQILKKHEIITYDDKDVTVNESTLKAYQPDHTQYQKHYDKLVAQENNHERLARVGTVAALSTAAIGLGYLAYRMAHAFN